jgi:hypothetical protein
VTAVEPAVDAAGLEVSPGSVVPGSVAMLGSLSLSATQRHRPRTAELVSLAAGRRVAAGVWALMPGDSTVVEAGATLLRLDSNRMVFV